MLKHLSRLFGSRQRQDSRTEPPNPAAALPAADIDLIVPMIKAMSDPAPEHPQLRSTCRLSNRRPACLSPQT
jgi:hypothetical protein